MENDLDAVSAQVAGNVNAQTDPCTGFWSEIEQPDAMALASACDSAGVIDGAGLGICSPGLVRNMYSRCYPNSTDIPTTDAIQMGKFRADYLVFYFMTQPAIVMTNHCARACTMSSNSRVMTGEKVCLCA